jgi:hypothetical protein
MMCCTGPWLVVAAAAGGAYCGWNYHRWTKDQNMYYQALDVIDRRTALNAHYRECTWVLP